MWLGAIKIAVDDLAQFPSPPLLGSCGSCDLTEVLGAQVRIEIPRIIKQDKSQQFRSRVQPRETTTATDMAWKMVGSCGCGASKRQPMRINIVVHFYKC